MRRLLAAAAAAVLLGAAPRPIVFSAPAGDRATGIPNAARPFDAILPDGRTVSPVGASVMLGANVDGLAISPDGRYAIAGGPALTVVDARAMRVVTVRDGSVADVAAVRDPSDPARTLVVASSGASLQFFALGDDGSLTPDGASVGLHGDALALSPDGRTAYVTDPQIGVVQSVDLAARRVSSSAPVGFSPDGLAVAGSRLYVTNGGVIGPATLADPVRIPQFGVVPPDAARASSMMAFGTLPGGGLDAGSVQTAPMDQAPDELTNIGGAKPTGIAVSKDGRFAFVCMTNVDRIAVVALAGVPRVVAGLSLRLFQSSAIGSAPYGTRPSAIVRSADGNRLYVAMAGINAIAVLDASKPVSLHRLGLIPTGWAPGALALSADGRYLYVANAKGNATVATLQRVDLRRVPLQAATLSALRYNRSVSYGKASTLVPPMRLDGPVRSVVIRHVVLILEGNAGFDPAAADPSTPNLNALARTFGYAANYATDRDLSDEGADPNAYPRAGYLFNALQRAGRSYRDYGGLLELVGYDRGAASHPTDDDPGYAGPGDVAAPTSGLGGLYRARIPALAALASHLDLDYPGWNPRIRDERRAREFVRDIGPLATNDAMPDYTYIWLPGRNAAQGDAAIGTIVAYLSHAPQWASTAIFIAPDGPRTTGDPVGRYRSYAIVVSPFARRGYAGRAHLSAAGLQKTEEELLGLPPLRIDDLLATDMADFFTAKADPSPFENL